ncbi:MAG: hypothetical protein CSA61_01505 [Neptuniibacter caesariensis]|uniref:CYTH domain-containing protein n=1 Tax=Neptuniibacter caesariensis TaxID=207954 RepID=A0A2G6JB14_NEPCE|nr:MAG: hypothetical protein CSA61_01505 [Neptuniibacter caesariensis]
MALEVELKLTLSPHHVRSLKQQPLFRSEQIRELGSQQLGNTYYDTPDQKLTEQRVALRIRRKGDTLIQTLKSNGTSEAGMHSRKEWEWLLGAPGLDYSLLAEAEWPKPLQDPELQRTITPVFSTNFNRTLWLLDTLDSQGKPLKVELALDEGKVCANGLEDPLCELELELLEGNACEMVKTALELARHVPLYISDISKAERGFRLLNPGAYSVQRPGPAFDNTTTLEQAFRQMLMQELTLWPRYFEAWRFSKDWNYIPLALESLRNTGALYETFSDIIPAEPDGEIEQLITRLIRQVRDINAWNRVQTLSSAPKTTWFTKHHTKAAARMEVLLQTAEPGILALLISDQLIEQPWRQRWNDAQQKKASSPIMET